MPVSLQPVLQAVLKDYVLPWQGDHGIAHWARVLENGLKIAEVTAADVEVVSLFAVLHDSRRVNEWSDPNHGPRAALFARTLRGSVFDLDDHQLELLCQACHGHTHERTHPDVTIQACWDADRLDLGRVGTTPHPYYLNTDFAKLPTSLNWADGRARFHFVPPLVLEEWGIDLTRSRSK